MVIAIGVLLALVCLGVATVPFMKYRRSRQTVDPTEVIAGLEEQRQQLYREMLTLEESSRAGAVPEPEFNAVAHTLRRRAAENLWLQHRWEERLAGLDEALETVISQAGVSIEAPAAEDEQSSLLCPECGATVAFDATVCPKCGAEKETDRLVSGGRAPG